MSVAAGGEFVPAIAIPIREFATFTSLKSIVSILFRCNSHWLKTYPKVCMLLRLEGTYVGWNQQYCLRNITNFNNTFLQILRVLFHHSCSPVFKDFELHVILLFLQEVAQEIEKVCDPLKAKSAILFATDQSASIQDVRRKTDKSKTVKGYKIPKCCLNKKLVEHIDAGKSNWVFVFGNYMLQ